MSTKTIGRRISVKPYLSGLPNGGYEKYDMVVADNIIHKEDLGFVERNGIKCYLTGLNEIAPEVQNIVDKEEKEAKIKSIRKNVVFLERTLAGNFDITENDIYTKDSNGKEILNDKFWTKVTMFVSQTPDKFDDKRNRIPTYWDKVEIKCGNKASYFDPANPHDLILIEAIKAGAFSTVAPSFEAAQASVNIPKFYLDEEISTLSVKTEHKKIKNKARTALQKLFDKDQNKLFYVVKACSATSMLYRKDTPFDTLYDDADEYINGKGQDKAASQSVNAETFIKYDKMPLVDLRVKVIVKDAIELQLFTVKQDGNIYYNHTSTPMGKGVDEVTEYLKSPLNGDILNAVSDKVEAEWKK